MKTNRVFIANPVYDVVFKYLLEDNAVAKLLVSSIIGEEVVKLDPKPQEYTTTQKRGTKLEGKSTMTVYRLDFSAKIKTPAGYKLVIIEMQKASLPTDIIRFRRYLGKQYSDENNVIPVEGGGYEAMQIYTIYFLGKDLGICDTPVLCIFPVIKDLATGTIVNNRSEFIDSLNHKSWVVQINCLKERRRNELEKLLSVFDQSNLTSDNHILNINEKEFPEKYRLIIRRLKAAASDVEVKEQMKEEDEFFSYMNRWFRKEALKMEGQMAEKDKIIAEKEKTIAEKEETIAENEKTIAEKEKTIAEKEKELEELRLKIKKAGL